MKKHSSKKKSAPSANHPAQGLLQNVRKSKYRHHFVGVLDLKSEVLMNLVYRKFTENLHVTNLQSKIHNIHDQ
jgi:hypothetical protein